MLVIDHLRRKSEGDRHRDEIEREDAAGFFAIDVEPVLQRVNVSRISVSTIQSDSGDYVVDLKKSTRTPTCIV